MQLSSYQKNQISSFYIWNLVQLSWEEHHLEWLVLWQALLHKHYQKEEP